MENGLHIDDHEKLWIIERYLEQMKEIIAAPIDPSKGGWSYVMHALHATAAKIQTFTKQDNQ